VFPESRLFDRIVRRENGRVIYDPGSGIASRVIAPPPIAAIRRKHYARAMCCRCPVGAFGSWRRGSRTRRWWLESFRELGLELADRSQARDRCVPGGHARVAAPITRPLLSRSAARMPEFANGLRAPPSRSAPHVARSNMPDRQRNTLRARNASTNSGDGGGANHRAPAIPLPDRRSPPRFSRDNAIKEAEFPGKTRP